MKPDDATLSAFTPTGRLRASINVGNPILASSHPVTGELRGVSVDLAKELARRLGVEIALIEFKSAGESVEAVNHGHADVGFFAIDPLRAEGIAFTDAYVLIEGCYLVREGSPIVGIAEVDRPGSRVAVGKGSAYDLFLTRELQHADIVRAPTSPSVVETFLEHDLDVAAGVRQQLEADMRDTSGLRLLPGSFMVIRQAMGVSKQRGEKAAGFLESYIEEMKASGFVAESLRRHGIEGATIAPPST